MADPRDSTLSATSRPPPNRPATLIPPRRKTADPIRHRETTERTENDFANFSVEADFGWTDDQARAAGWVRSALGFGWRETLRNAGRIVVMPSGAFMDDHFDLAEVRVEAVDPEPK